MREVTLVVGPPCAGKSTWVAEHAHPGDTVVDYDVIAADLGSSSTHDHSYEVRSQVRHRRAELEEAVAASIDGRSWVVRTAADPGERRGVAERLRATRVVVLDPGVDEVMARAYAAGRPPWTGDAIHRWYAATTSR